MAEEQNNGVHLKLWVDKKNQSVVFAESGSDFVDVLFSLLTIPMGKVVSFAAESQERALGCFNNLYQSVENADAMHFHFRPDACKSMLLAPRSSAERHCSELKLKIDDSDPTSVFTCSNKPCHDNVNRVRWSRYPNVLCQCLRPMNYLTKLSMIGVVKDENGNLFVRGGNMFIITDDLRVLAWSTEAMLSFFSKHGITNNSELEQMNLTLNSTQVKTMLIYSLVSRKVLTRIFLEKEQELRPRKVVSFLKLNSGECGPEVASVEPIRVKLIISKSQTKVCYAEASRDFINLLFSFLTVPIGHIAKQIHGESHLDMSIDKLYKSAVELDDHCFRTTGYKESLLSPRLSYGFCYRNDLLGIHGPPNNYNCRSKTYDEFLTGPNGFIVSGCLKITPLSASACLSILKDLNVRSDDLVEHVINVGKNEALLLLVNSLVTENALSTTFLKESKQRVMKEKIATSVYCFGSINDLVELCCLVWNAFKV